MEQVDQKKSLSQQLHDKASKISIGYDIEAHDKHWALHFPSWRLRPIRRTFLLPSARKSCFGMK